MIHVELRFPAGRYHATPPDHHVNEGLIEWPPSPWRFSRALLATGFRTLGWPADAPPPSARGLVEALAERPPTYVVPSRPGRGELRSWAPAPERTTLLVDAFCRLAPEDRVVMGWPTALEQEGLALLDALLVRLPYLGRAESWVRARRVDAPAPRPGELVLAPADPERPTPADADPLELLAPLSRRGLLEWREAAMAAAREHDPGTPRRVADRLRRIEALYPRDVTGALLVGSEQIIAERWSAPPGSRRVAYDLPRAAAPSGPPGRGAPAPRLAPRRASRVYFALTPQAPAVAALGIAERVHRRIAASAESEALDLRARLLGLDPGGAPLRGHRHLHLVPHLRGPRLVGLLAHLPAGWTEEAEALVRASVRGTRGAVPSALVGPAREWRSATPFLCPRHPRRGRASPEAQLLDALAALGLPEPAELQLWSSRAVREAGFFCFSRSRARPGRGAPLPRPHGFSLRFGRPVEGPIAAGYGVHFGLGAFVAGPGGPPKVK